VSRADTERETRLKLIRIGTRWPLALLLSVLILVTGGDLQASASPTGQDIAQVFQSFYAQSGGLAVFGYPITATLDEGGYTVQYFERQRLEYHPELAGTSYQILLGLVGEDAAQSLGLNASKPFQPLPATTGSDGTCTFMPETGHRVCAGFRDFWRGHGVNLGDPGTSFRESLALFGYPLSEEFTDPATGLTVQYFQRARFEYHPEFAGTPNVVELSLLGQAAFDQAQNGDPIATSEGVGSGMKAAAGKKQATTVASSGTTTGSARVLFGVYPGGGNGEVGYVTPPSASQIIGAVNTLRGGRPASVHLYTAWSWYNQAALDNDIATYTGAGYSVSLTIKYSPPSGHVGDSAGFAAFVRGVVSRYASNARVTRYVIGNEINVVNGNPSSSDGPITGVRTATIQGVLAAQSELARVHSNAKVGTDLAVLERNTDAKFMQDLAKQGGPSFVSAIGFLGLNVYPGLWPAGSGDAYGDMATYLTNARYTLSNAGFGSGVTIEVLENGYPTTDEAQQATKLDAFVRAVCDNAGKLGISGYSWFDLWDANSSSTSLYDHYGLMRSDLSPKPAFTRYQQAFASTCSVTG
jgi:hypothetical protein